MFKDSVRTPEQALAYITDCNLATVCDMAMTKRRKVGEFRRQKAIAQTAIDWMDEMHIDYSTTRAKDVVKFGTVEKWAESFMPERKGE